jgi:protein gp37
VKPDFEGNTEVRTDLYPFGFEPTYHRYRLCLPAAEKKSKNIFVCSMGELFGDWIPDNIIKEVFKACENAPQHNYLFLTKNPARYNQYFSFRDNRPSNFYFGTSAATNNDIVRIRHTQAKSLNFLSVEPIHEFVNLGKLFFEAPGRIQWIIVGAESGNRKGKVIPEKEWIENIVRDCEVYDVPLFMKDSLVPIIGEENMKREFPEGLQKIII